MNRAPAAARPAVLRGPAKSSARRRRRGVSDSNYALLLIAPAALVLLALVGWPLLKLLIDSLHTGSTFDPGGPRFGGLANYRDLFTDPAVRSAGVRTLVYTVVVVAAELALGLAVALLFYALGPRSQVLRTAFLYPLMIAPLVAGLLWRFMLIDNFGIVNELLTRVGLLRDPSDIAWLSNPHLVLFSVAIPDVWLTTSFMTLMIFAGLQSIPPELLESARLDGAQGLRLLRTIILPLLRPVIAVALIIRGVDAARAFDTILIQTGGGPQSASETLSLHIYKTMVTYNDPGSAAAMSTVFMAVTMVVALIAVMTIWRPGRES
ncbi:carbohydrate ABC transporter permease [Actinoplanes sp. NPDC051513]|uniref:carbohydrate ABC transporter permease n=1 Tax=Actinoplanes sp. NPDC051513 TaxID=3363908 RepID=UPI0037B31164